jgi:hypothetical protein
MPRSPAYSRRAPKARNKVSIIKKAKRSKKMQVIVAVLSFFLLTTISAMFLFGVGVYRIVTQSLTSALSPSSHDVISDSTYTILVIDVDSFNKRPLLTDKVDFYVLDKSSKKVSLFHVDPSIVLDLPGPLKEESLNKVLALGMMGQGEFLDPGVFFMKRTIQKLFGYKVDKYILTKSDYYPQISRLLNFGSLDGFFNLDELTKLSGSIKTDLSVGEVYDTYRFINTLPSDRITAVNLTQNLVENPTYIDDTLAEISFDSNVAEERKSVAVLNGSGVTGLASYGSRVAVNHGARVTFLDSTTKIFSTSVIVADDPTSYTVRDLARFFGINTIISKERASELNEAAVDRADVVLILGLDTSESLY